jgi:group I intron endonuclease
MGILYKLTFSSGKSYIGISSKSLRRRLVTHRSHAKKRDFPIHRAINKYPEFAAEVLVMASDMDYLKELERRAIDAFGTLIPGGYNLSPGGDIIRGAGPVSDALRISLRERAQARAQTRGELPGQLGNNATLGYRHTAEAKMKIGLANVGVEFTAERRAKMGATKVGNTFNVGRPCAEATKRKISAAQLGKPCPARGDGQRGKPKSAASVMAMIAAKKGKPWGAARRAAHKNRNRDSGATAP